MSLSHEELDRFVSDLVARPDLWEHHVDRDARERVYVELHSDSDLNAWLIVWSEDSDTGFHDHDNSRASVAVLEGAIVDERLRLGGPAERRVHRAGAALGIPPSAIHRVTHAGGRAAVTIHAYSPPLVRQGAYRVTATGTLEREVQSSEVALRAEMAIAAA